MLMWLKIRKGRDNISHTMEPFLRRLLVINEKGSAEKGRYFYIKYRRMEKLVEEAFWRGFTVSITFYIEYLHDKDML